MKQYIDKAAVVAEIEKRVVFNNTIHCYARKDECNAILSFLDTLEVKEVDLMIHTFLYSVKNNKQGVFTFTRLQDEQYQEVLN